MDFSRIEEFVMEAVTFDCGCGGGGGGKKAGNSYPAGTEVLTPDGPVAIEDLREGNLVLARDDETGVSGVFPVTALMARTAADVLWLTLEDADGQTSRMGVTSKHPLFTVGQGWLTAEDLAPGDAIRNSDLRELTVLAVETDPSPRRVHNLEVAGRTRISLAIWRRGGIMQIHFPACRSGGWLTSCAKRGRKSCRAVGK